MWLAAALNYFKSQNGEARKSLKKKQVERLKLKKSQEPDILTLHRQKQYVPQYTTVQCVYVV